MRFENKTAVVTGGSRGIGLAIATKLAKEGANIAILYVGDENEGIKAKEELSQYGTKVEQYFCDVSNFEESKKVVDQVIEEFGSIEILVNNAGITRDKLVLNMDEKDFDAVINVNLKGTFNMIKHTYKHFMKKRYGRICSTASIVGLTGNAGAPGYIATDMTSVLPDKVKDAMKAQIPAKRIGTPDDVADVVAFLCSDDAAYVTGEVIRVDGGLAM